jgi:predicted DsbA family dithiol-disulfide isomerase
MPADGLDRKAYRSRKFGSWEYSQALDAKTAEAGRSDGAEFDYAAIKRTPNTLRAHRVAALAARDGRQATFALAILKAYFAEGRDIGAKTVLADIAHEIGLDRNDVLALLDGDDGTDEIRALEQDAQDRGVNSVPSIEIAGIVINGAQSVQVIRQAIIDAAAHLSHRAASTPELKGSNP